MTDELLFFITLEKYYHIHLIFFSICIATHQAFVRAVVSMARGQERERNLRVLEAKEKEREK